ncbi:sensor histidine kinase [Nonlabens ulvanivorans]|uniref:histidine kinase n=1 Tax=Nonlabens ulvanivorans TaxID=906888 RepID=A0A084JTM4_NONUL|nr:ATP-binding protein [Nonlabens ulvanivorans]KEZ92308.1 histidine kinase [Nonlabens ulvanivorans]PRX15141.1 phospho-acceptor domain-containing protein [Nonlabens ulvanivorans]
MNSLLKRQIRKYLGEELAQHPDFKLFFDAINSSYNTHDDQFAMLQRAMSISSQELFEANKELKERADSQTLVIDKLNNVINTLKSYDLTDDGRSSDDTSDSFGLVNLIDRQTKEILAFNQQREELLSELSHQNQELSDYAHMVSHDLKSPLRSIDALASWISEDYSATLDKKGIDNLELIRSNVQKMDTLINGILEYSTIGKTKVLLYDVDLQVLIDTILSIVYVPDHVEIVLLNPLPVVQGDKYRLQQLFQNLIDNAIKYNDKENGLIEINVEELSSHWQFSIKDNGLGIDKPYFEKIFNVFQKLENNVNSSGIGLSIVKKVVELYQGEIWVESQLNLGTTFYFTLPKK